MGGGGSGGAKSFHPLKGGGHNKLYPVLKGGGGQKVSDLRFSHFVASLPVINDQSLGVLLVIIGKVESRLFT